MGDVTTGANAIPQKHGNKMSRSYKMCIFLSNSNKPFLAGAALAETHLQLVQITRNQEKKSQRKQNLSRRAIYSFPRPLLTADPQVSLEANEK